MPPPGVQSLSSASADARPVGSPPADGVRAGLLGLSRRGRMLRLAVVVAVVLLLAWGSWRGTDDAFPAGPFVMFAFTTPPDGDVVSAAVESVDSTGHRSPVALEPAEVGLRRAEMEGQIPRVVAHPELLGALARAHARLHPHSPSWQQVDLVEQHVTLHDGRESRRFTVLLASWHR